VQGYQIENYNTLTGRSLTERVTLKMSNLVMIADVLFVLIATAERATPLACDCWPALFNNGARRQSHVHLPSMKYGRPTASALYTPRVRRQTGPLRERPCKGAVFGIAQCKRDF
jgi:hypothetical protein